jgi:isoquinoline 1-oxidoreductase/isoquinoline 1-oxidoreductase beta subunit
MSNDLSLLHGLSEQNTKIPNGLPATRRQFLKASLTTAGGFSLGMALPGCSSFRANSVSSEGAWSANAWLEITAENKVVFTLDRVEMGQGTYTGLTTLLAEELNVTPESVEVIFAPSATPYRNPVYGLQITGGSNSLSSSWPQIREAGATALAMLKAAAADLLLVPIDNLEADNTFIVFKSENKKIPYGTLAKLASKQDIPSPVVLKDPADFKYIGRQNKRLDAGQKINGQAVYGIDVDIEGMRYAVLTRPSQICGVATKFNKAHVESLSGVEAVVETSRGIAIVASSYWLAKKAQSQLLVEWQVHESDALKLDSKSIEAFYKTRALEDSGASIRSEGDIDEALEQANEVLELEYTAPFLAHATMEPMNCVAHVRDGRADIWTSTQAPDVARVAVAKVTDLSLDEISIHNHFIGGGFGRRLSQDFIAEAAEISAKAGGIVKLVWSREEDIKHDLYRPASFHKLQISLDDRGLPLAWGHQIVAPKILDWSVWDAAPAVFPWAPKFMYSSLGKVALLTEGTPATPPDTSPYEGVDNLPYNIKAIEVKHTKADAGIPVSYWRSVGHSFNAFVVETAIDELAEKAGIDSYEYRRRYLDQSPRLLGVLEAVAKLGKWGRNYDQGVYQGIAVHESFGSYVAQLVELKIDNNEIKLLKVFCAVDCGLAVNPDIVKMQMESGIIFGATAALYGEITFEQGAVVQSNFHDYPIMRMNQCPEIETLIIESAEAPTGVGEPGLPPLAPAMANALFKATGKRHRTLPFKLT